MPVSTLMCTSIRRPAPCGRGAEPFEVAEVVDDGRQALADDVVLVPVVVGAEDEDRGADPRRPQLEPLLDQRYGQRVAQRLQRAGHRDRAVPISVGLDHPEHGDRRPDQLAKPGQVPLHGAEIDLRDRRDGWTCGCRLLRTGRTSPVPSPRLWACWPNPAKFRLRMA